MHNTFLLYAGDTLSETEKNTEDKAKMRQAFLDASTIGLKRSWNKQGKCRLNPINVNDESGSPRDKTEKWHQID